MANTNKKSSAKKKLIPAAAMLACSAVMLSAATYAWFTMSRDVEVTGLKMKASVPEDLQISVGTIESKTLNATDSYLTNADAAPTDAVSWSNTVNISQYYTFGKLIPASSNDGVNIFFTPDANGVGKTEKVNAKYYQAAEALTPKADTTVASGTGNSLMATAHAIVNANDTWSGTRASAYNYTHDDGYYVDVPVYIRSSSKEAVQLSVAGYVTPATNAHAADANIELYKATRVAILLPNGATGSGTAGIMDLKDGSGTGWASAISVIDYYGTSGTHGVANGAVWASGDAPGTTTVDANGNVTTNANTTWDALYKAYTRYTAGTPVVTIPAAEAQSEYGTPQKVWIRVWLEGEDPECWNQNAGQDWNISLKFTKV